MLHILFMILKIAGIIIAIILGIALILILTVLFVPVRYRIDGTCGGTVDSLEGKIKFSWLLHLFSGYFVYSDNKADWQVRLAWKKMNVPEASSEENILPSAEEETVEKGEESQKREPDKTEIPKESCQKETSERPKKSESDKKCRTKKGKTIFQKISCTITKICDNIKLLREKKDKVLEFLEHEIHRNAFTKIKTELTRLCRVLKPGKIKGHIHYGFEDPYITGKVLAGVSMLYPFYGDAIAVKPDFEQPVLEGDLYIKGHMHVISFLIIVFRCIFNKDIRITYKHFKKLRR